MAYQLHYWPGIQGRGEFVRLALEAAGAPYVDVARGNEDQDAGLPAMLHYLEDASVRRPPFASPFLVDGKTVIGQTAAILLYLGPRLKLAPAREADALWLHQIQLTLADLVVEAHDLHHPIASSLYYEDQKQESITYSKHFLAERVPKFLGYFERVLGGREYLVNDRLSYVDLSMFQLIEGLRFAFPNTMKRIEPSYPGLVALHDRVAARPNIAAYLKSPRRLGWNDRGVFRHYPDLDQ